MVIYGDNEYFIPIYGVSMGAMGVPQVRWMVYNQWKFQDPKMEVVYHIRPYFVGMSAYIALTWASYMVGTSILGSWHFH